MQEGRRNARFSPWLRDGRHLWYAHYPPRDSLLHVLYHAFLCLEQLPVSDLHAMYLSLHCLDLALPDVRVDRRSCLPCQLRLLLPQHDLTSVIKQCMFLYSAVSSPLDCSKSFTLHHLADPLSIDRYSFIQLSELGCHGLNENNQASKQ